MISEEEKKIRRQEYETNLNMFLADCDDEYIEYRLANRPDKMDLIYERWINGEIELDEVNRLVNEYINSL